MGVIESGTLPHQLHQLDDIDGVLLMIALGSKDEVTHSEPMEASDIRKNTLTPHCCRRTI